MDAEEFGNEYVKLSHAMQTGVAHEMQLGLSSATEPKHLRVGVNGALRDHASLVNVLVAKGLMTLDEYYEAILTGLREEVAQYEHRLSKHFGRNITLG